MAGDLQFVNVRWAVDAPIPSERDTVEQVGDCGGVWKTERS